jgi:hypothetical protein
MHAHICTVSGQLREGMYSYHCQVVFNRARQKSRILHPRLIVSCEKDTVSEICAHNARYGHKIPDSEKNGDADLLVLVHSQLHHDGDGKSRNDELRKGLDRASPHGSPSKHVNFASSMHHSTLTLDSCSWHGSSTPRQQ